MRRFRTLVAVGSALVASAGFAGSASADAGGFSGTVTGPGGAPVDAATTCVFVSNPASSVAPRGHTSLSPDGTYRFVGLSPGAYRVKFDSCDPAGSDTYGLQYYRAAKRPGDATNVTVPSGAERTGVDATLEAGTSISGHVYGSPGTDVPLAGACVSVAEPSPDLGGVTIERRVSTDATGAYAVHGLAAGVDYRVQFERCNAPGSPAYRPEWYDDQPSPQTAKAVTPTLADPAVGIDAHLESAEPGGVLGGTAPSGSSPPAGTQGGTTGGQTTSPPATAPTITLSALRTGRLAQALRTGLKLPLSCSRSCDLGVRLTVDGRTAKRLGLARKAIETTVGSAAAKGSRAKRNLVVRFTAKSRKALKTARTVRLVVTVVAGDGTGPRRTTKRTLTLRR